MTNDYAIQQQKSPSALPYVGTGLVGGAAAGYFGLPAVTGKYKTADDIVKEVNSKDVVDIPKNVTEADLNDVREAAAKVKEAEEKLAQANKAALPDTAKEAKELAEAKDKLAKEIERLQAIENKKVGTRTVVTGAGEFPKAANIPNFAEVQRTNPASLNAVWADGKKAGKSMTGSELQSTYNRLKGAIATQEAKLASDIAPLETRRTQRIRDLKNLATGYERATAGLTEEQLGEYFVKEYRNPTTWVTELTPQYQLARAKAMADCGNPANINISTLKTNPDLREGLLSISHPKEKGEKIDYRNQETARIKNAEGKWQEVVFNKDDALNLIKEEQQKLESRIESSADEIFEKMRASVELQRASSPTALRNEFEMVESNVVKESVAAKTGFYNATTGKLDVNRLMQGNRLTLAGVQTQKAAYQAELSAFKGLGLAKDQIVDRATLRRYNISGSGLKASEVEQIIKARANTMKAFETRITDINKEANAMFEEISSVKELTEKIAEKKANFEPLTKAQEAFVRQFGDVEATIMEDGKPKKIKVSEATTATSTTVEGTAKTITEADVEESFRKAVKDKQELYDAAAKKSGTVDTAAKEAAEKLKADAEKTLKDKAEALAKKWGKTGKMNKWLGAGIGAAALALGGWAIAPKKDTV